MGKDLEQFIHLLKKLRRKIIDNSQGKNLTNETVNIIILRFLFLSFLSYFGILPKKLAVTKLGQYQNLFQNHNLLLWSQNDSNNYQIEEKKLILLLKIISDFIFNYSGNKILTVLGIIYQALQAEDSRKRKGMFFTPLNLASVIFSSSFSSLFPKRDILEMETSAILNLKILDNACGGGVFLISAVEHILDVLREFLEKKDSKDMFDTSASVLNHILSEMIYGVDSDYNAIAVTEAQLWLHLAATYGNLENWTWNNRNLTICDTLIDSKLESNTFDLIIGNPPYMRLSSLSKEYQKTLRKRYNVRREYNLHALFVKKSLKLLREGGVLGYLLHKNILTLETYRAMREQLINNYTCLDFVDCGQGLFKGVTAETVFVVIKKGPHELDSSLNLAIYDFKSKNIMKKMSILQKEYSKLISQWNYRFPIHLSSKGWDLLSYLQDYDRLGNYVTISRGIETGSNVDYLSDIPMENGTWIPLLRGRDISAYNGKHQVYLNYDRKLLSKPGRSDLCSIPKVILQQNANRPIAYFDDGKFAVLNSTTYLADASLELLNSFCVFLNSKLVEWFFRTVVTNFSNLTINILPNNLRLIPIPSSFDQKVFTKLCNILHDLETCKDKTPQSQKIFGLWYHIIAEASVSEAYIQDIHEGPRIQNMLRQLMESKDLTEESLNSSQFQSLLSIAKKILSSNILKPVRQIL